MGDLVNSFSTALTDAFQTLAAVPGQVISIHGVAAGTGFMALGVANSYIRPMVRQSAQAIPGGVWLVGIYDGVFQLAQFQYGTKVMK